MKKLQQIQKYYHITMMVCAILITIKILTLGVL